MSNALIGRLLGCDNNGRLIGKGVYHWGAPPPRLGPCLFRLFRETYKGDLESMLQAIVDAHPAGWNDLEKQDCYCHTRGAGVKGYELRDLEWATRMDCHWAYLFAFEKGEPIMVVAHRMARWSPAFLEPLEEWAAGEIVPLNGDEPDWKNIELSGYGRYADAYYAVHGKPSS
jgi:broad specificity phosphatase PhoE